MSSEALETQGDLPFTTSECAETWTGHRKPKNKVVDMRQVVDVLPMFEVGSTGQTWHGKHVKELKAPDERCQCADDVAVCRDLPESRSEAPEPADNISGQAGGLSMQDGPQIPSQENQHAGMNSKTIANVLDPPGLCSRLQREPLAQAHSATNTVSNLSYMRRSSKRRETKHLELDCKQASNNPRLYETSLRGMTYPVRRSTAVGGMMMHLAVDAPTRTESKNYC
ncbi:hypothetical protein EDD16DRAFT_1520132 [Pisolithus croceorrhizus]|nr:hypothetical protein EDD16DRAFT_1520132 [Pisolithus croceorrhizus]KAI6117886.1 hypothetical protein EV401DRAFT_1888693 [Pisolithus croceorrhizus]